MYQVFLNVEEIDHRILKEPGEMRLEISFIYVKNKKRRYLY